MAGCAAVARWILTHVALLAWMGGIHLNMVATLSIILCYSLGSAYLGSSLLAVWLLLALIPISEGRPWAVALSRFICRYASEYFPIEVVVEDSALLDPSLPYLFAAEPHSVLPIGVIGLNPQALQFNMQKIKVAATSAIFHVPVLRHVWSWMGLTSASRGNIKSCLESGTSIILVPGGVQECLYMRQSSDKLFVVYMEKRKGFVRVAMEAGAAGIVPIFLFGQNETYGWWRPDGMFFRWLSRQLGFAPLVFWGVLGSPLPYSSRMRIIVGRPIPLCHQQNPANDEVAGIHREVISSMAALFERHKTESGYADSQLQII
eukprot:TRINITY_DN5960_c0_g1_i2.p1 TRINITY_DN5960_c0_g1~~TRINITY_DN5960_c0_g1_i2.p1  ORF type:complete len:330 (+),score=60.87 TRINITY_DN5960_c0_g1_i2:38-991(+)